MHAMVNEELLISVKYANTIHFSTISPLLNWKQLLLLSFVPSWVNFIRMRLFFYLFYIFILDKVLVSRGGRQQPGACLLVGPNIDMKRSIVRNAGCKIFRRLSLKGNTLCNQTVQWQKLSSLSNIRIIRFTGSFPSFLQKHVAILFKTWRENNPKLFSWSFVSVSELWEQTLTSQNVG